MDDPKAYELRRVSRSFAWLNFWLYFGAFVSFPVASAWTTSGLDAWLYILAVFATSSAAAAFCAWLLYLYAHLSVRNAMLDHEELYEAGYLKKMWMVWRALGK